MNETTQNFANNLGGNPPPGHVGVPMVIIVLGVLAVVALVAFLYRHNFTSVAPAGGSAAGDPKSSGGTPPENLSAERDRVLRMLEAGKITPQESAELLNALSHPTPAPPKPKVALGHHARLILAGAALVLVGFFLPWFRFNLGAEMQHAMSQLGANGGGMFGGSGNGQGMFGGFPGNAIVTASGGDIKNGLGWIVLLLGLAAAVLPYLAAGLDFPTLKKIKLTILGIGAFVLIYLTAEGIRGAYLGLLVVLVGYALEIFGTVKEESA